MDNYPEGVNDNTINKHFGSSDWQESCQERLDEEIMDYIIEDEQASIDFIIYIEDTLGKKKIEKLINSWIETKHGKIWYESTLERMTNDHPEPEREDYEGDR